MADQTENRGDPTIGGPQVEPDHPGPEQKEGIEGDTQPQGQSQFFDPVQAGMFGPQIQERPAGKDKQKEGQTEEGQPGSPFPEQARDFCAGGIAEAEGQLTVQRGPVPVKGAVEIPVARVDPHPQRSRSFPGQKKVIVLTLGVPHRGKRKKIKTGGGDLR